MTLVLFITSCSKYVDNKYYESGNLSQINYYNDKKLDSSLFFYDTIPKILKKKHFSLNKDTLHVIEFSKQRKKLREGKKIVSLNSRIGKWELFNRYNKNFQILEYKIIDKKEYLNQSWYVDKEGDTLKGKGNYIKFTTFGKVTSGKSFKLGIELKEYLLSNKSKVFVCLPTKSLKDVNEDFSNKNLIKWDTFPSLSSFSREFEEYNHSVLLSLEFKEKGVKNVRGFLVEEIGKELINPKDTFEKKQRIIYFNKKILVE